MSNNENNNSAISNPEIDDTKNSKNNVAAVQTTVKKTVFKDARFIFGDMNGLIKQNYVKYFNLVCFEFLFTIIFAILYYLLLLNSNKHFIVPSYLHTRGIFDNRLLIALFISLNFQSTVANVYVKCNDLLSVCLINLQIFETMFLALLFIIVE
jgi:hypothetical protein